MTDFRALCAELLADYELNRFRAELAAEARAALADGAGVGVTDEELLELSARHGVSYTMSTGEVIYPMQEGCDMRDDVLSFARAVLARYGTHPRPIPVAWPRPTEADCDDLAMCWWYDRHNGAWTRCDYAYAKNHGFRYWLPAAAIPLPEASP
jgi:hypothetical protein